MGSIIIRRSRHTSHLPKVKDLVSPLLEATQSGKPIIASGWSGHLDFLNPEEAVLVGGELKQVEPGAVWEGVILSRCKMV
jgi:hypothetical protein